jgi:hypothetical protein
MTVLAIKPERRRMRIRMTPATTPNEVSGDWSSVIVAAKTSSRGVRPLEGVAGLGLMVERKVFPEYIPAFRDVADSAVARKSPVWHERAPLFTPTFPWD